MRQVSETVAVARVAAMSWMSQLAPAWLAVAQVVVSQVELKEEAQASAKEEVKAWA